MVDGVPDGIHVAPVAVPVGEALRKVYLVFVPFATIGMANHALDHSYNGSGYPCLSKRQQLSKITLDVSHHRLRIGKLPHPPFVFVGSCSATGSIIAFDFGHVVLAATKKRLQCRGALFCFKTSAIISTAGSSSLAVFSEGRCISSQGLECFVFLKKLEEIVCNRREIPRVAKEVEALTLGCPDSIDAE